MLALKSINRDSLIEFDGLLFMLIEKENEVDIDQLYYVDAVIINSIEGHIFENLLNGIRQHYNPQIYLKPVYAVFNQHLAKRYLQGCDDTTDLVQYQNIAKKTKFINQRIESLFQLQRFPTTEMEYLFKMLQFLYTRDEQITPQPNRKSKIGYHFPMLSRLIKDEDSQLVYKVIEDADHKGYLATAHFDKIHLCDCGSAHHTIRETCKSCGSIDLHVEDLIHHFQCAYVGPESDFRDEDEYNDQLNCPKCSKVIRHIGIDYDKPSQIYQCSTCNHRFQEPAYTYHCLDCDSVRELRHLNEHAVSNLSITSKGTNLVLKGLPKANAGLRQSIDDNKTLGIYSYDIFQLLTRQEEARVRKSGAYSVLGNIMLTEEEVNRLSSREVHNLQIELCKVLKSYVGDNDMISSQSPASYQFLLTESSADKAQELKGMVEYNFKELITGNFPDIDVKIDVQLQVLGRQSLNQQPSEELN